MSGSVGKGTRVFVQRDGIVNHAHDGVKGWHNPATKHGKDLHTAHKAAAPVNGAEVLKTDALRKQYAAALGGKSFYGIYAKAVAARREEAGDNWAYGKRVKADEAATAIAEAQAVAAEAFEKSRA